MPPDPKHCFPLLVAQLLRALSAAMSSAGETNSSHASWTSGIWKPKTILPHQSMECLLPVPAPPCLRLGPLPPGSYFYTFVELYPVHLPLPGAHCSSTEAFSYSETDSHTELLKSERRKRNHLFLDQCVQFPLLPFCQVNSPSGLHQGFSLAHVFADSPSPCSHTLDSPTTVHCPLQGLHHGFAIGFLITRN